MPAPYLIDLGQRVINAYEAKEGTQRQLAQRFQVSQSLVTRLIRRYQRTGTIEPKSRGQRRFAACRSKSQNQNITTRTNRKIGARTIRCFVARVMRSLGRKNKNQSKHLNHAP